MKFSMSSAKIQKQFKGNVGMFLVAAKLSSMNMIALPTSRNTKGYDIVVMDPGTGRGKGIQVKCSDKEVFSVTQTRLKDYDDKIEEKILCDYIFVDISDIDKSRFFIVPKEELKKTVKQSVQNYIDKSRHRKPLETLMSSENPHNWVISLRDIAKYEDKWETLVDF